METVKSTTMKKLLTLAAVLQYIVITTPQAHSQTVYSQFGSIAAPVNPAASLLRNDVGEISVVGRRQWAGMEGAPTYYWGTGYVALQGHEAKIGLNVRHENVAVEKNSEFSAYFAKAVRLSFEHYLGMSLNAGMTLYDGRFSSVDPGDPLFKEDIRESDALVGFGLMLYSPERYYVGLSLPRMTLSTLGVGKETRYNFRNQYHLLAGGWIWMGSDMELNPTVLVTHANGFRPQVDLTTLLYFKKMVGIGAGLRSYGDLTGMIQLNFEGFGIGYSYQFNPKNEPLNRRISNTTHEIGVSYRVR